MRRLLVLLLILAFLAPSSEAKRRAMAPPAAFDVTAVDAIAATALQSGIPGLTIAIRKRNALFTRAYGMSDREANVPAHVDSIYQIGSVTKQFTAAAIMRLVEEGKLRVEDKARVWLPELDARFDAITIEHLLTHTSGVRDYNVQLENAYQPKTQQEIFALITNAPPQFAPGSLYVYSNSGYYLLGMIIERASNRTYEQYLRETFFEPLSLRRTSYCGTQGPSPDGYWLNRAHIPRLPAADMSLLYAAGALCSTATDLVRWSDALANGVAVSPASYARMTTGVDPTAALPPGYGYALVLDQLQGRRWIWHNGDVLGFESHVGRFEQEDLVIVVLTNGLDLDGDRATAIAVAIARAML